MDLVEKLPRMAWIYSTVTLLARLRGLSTSVPRVGVARGADHVPTPGLANLGQLVAE